MQNNKKRNGDINDPNADAVHVAAHAAEDDVKNDLDYDGYDGLDLNELMKAVEDKSTDYLLGLTTDKIYELNLSIVKKLRLPKKDTLNFMKKINGYKYVDELEELKYGRFIRYVPLTNPEDTPLSKGGVICELKIHDTGVHIICKNFAHKHFKINMDRCLIFQKLSAQEHVLMSALDHLAK